MNRKLFVLTLAAALLAVQANAEELRHESKRLGLSFRYPQNFLIGQPMPLPGSDKRAEAMAKHGLKYTPPDEELLVDRRSAAGQDLKALRRDVLQIFLSRQRGSDAKFSRELLMKDQFRQRIGAWEVYVFPGAPGPYGDHAFYYLVSLKDGSVLEILASRSTSYPGDPDDKPTHYDRVIQRLIESLEVME
jgi:hypothetical protein